MFWTSYCYSDVCSPDPYDYCNYSRYARTNNVPILLVAENIPVTEEVTLTPSVFSEDEIPSWLDEIYYSDVTVEPIDDDSVFDMRITPPTEEEHYIIDNGRQGDNIGQGEGEEAGDREREPARKQHGKEDREGNRRPGGSNSGGHGDGSHGDSVGRHGGRNHNNRRRPSGGDGPARRPPRPPGEEYREPGEGPFGVRRGWDDNGEEEEEDYGYGEWLARPEDVEARERARDREREKDDMKQRDVGKKLVVTTRLVSIHTAHIECPVNWQFLFVG